MHAPAPSAARRPLPPRWRRPACGPPAPVLGSLTLALVLALALTGCASGGGDNPVVGPTGSQPAIRSSPPPRPDLPGAAEPGVAPAVTATPVGRVTLVGTGPEGVVVDAAGVAAVALRDPGRVVLVDVDTGQVTQTVMTAGAPRHLQLGGATPRVLVPLEQSDTLLDVSLSGGAVLGTAAGLARQPHDAALADTGVVGVSDELGGGVAFVRLEADGRLTTLGHSNDSGDHPVQPGGIAAVGPYVAAPDVRSLGLYVYDTRTMALVAQAKIGVGLTHDVTLPGGRVAVADTVGGAVIIDRITPQVVEQGRVSTGGRPYGLAVDPSRQRLYVALSLTNRLLAFDVSGAQPRQLADVPTVQQPNSLAVDPRNGDVLVAGGTKGELQLVPRALLGG